jgi:GcrA cell cycle regulator
MSEWTAEQIDYVKALVEEGLTGGMIAKGMSERFRLTFSRSAIIGKLRRLGIALANARDAEVGRRISVAKRKANAARPPRPRKQLSRRFSLPRFEIPDPDTFDNAIPLEQRKQLLELKNNHCRWPIGDPCKPGFFFCGAPEADLSEKRPYCPVHTMRARDIPQPHRERRAGFLLLNRQSIRFAASRVVGGLE